VRMTYAAAEEGEIEGGVERLAEVIRDEFEF
jgi:DNA-binding transcriptional MocR family regulator